MVSPWEFVEPQPDRGCRARQPFPGPDALPHAQYVLVQGAGGSADGRIVAVWEKTRPEVYQRLEERPPGAEAGP